MNLTIRDLDESVYRRFKAKAVEEGLRIGEAVTQAMELWIRQRSIKPKGSLLDIKPFNWGRAQRRLVSRSIKSCTERSHDPPRLKPDSGLLE